MNQYRALLESGILRATETVEKTGQQLPNVIQPLKDLVEMCLIDRRELSKKRIVYSVHIPDLILSLLDLGESEEEVFEEEDYDED